MSKIFYIILLSIALTTIKCQSDNAIEVAESIYNIIYELFSGMANGTNMTETESQCIQVIKKNKAGFINNLMPIVNTLQDSSKLFRTILNSGLKILSIHGFAKNCKILNVINIYNSLTVRKNVYNIGETIYNNAQEITDVFGVNFTDHLFYKIGRLAYTTFQIKVK